MITAALSAVILWCLFYKIVPLCALAPLCAGLAAFFGICARRGHSHYLEFDVLAQISRLARVNAGLKLLLAVALMFVSAASRGLAAGLFLTAVMSAVSVATSRLKLLDYLRLLSLPLSFLLLGGLAIMVEIGEQTAGILNLRVFGVFLCVTRASRLAAGLAMSRALGAVCCLYFLALGTPMPEIIGALRKARCPGVIIELMYLIYRYIFRLLVMHADMRVAAKSRLGYRGFAASVRTSALLYAGLLSRSYRAANLSFDAMESRCYTDEIRFLEHGAAITFNQVVLSALIVAASIALAFIPL